MNNYDEATLKEYKLPDLYGSWKGGERLRKVLNDENGKILAGYDGFANTIFFRIFQKPNNLRLGVLREGDLHHRKLDGQKKSLENKDYSTKNRFSTKHWISRKQRLRWKAMFKRILLLNTYFLVTLRSFMFILSAVALEFAISVYRDCRGIRSTSVSQQSSTIIAMVPQSVAMVYLTYIVWSEYSGKPLGIRKPLDKFKLYILDLLFIMVSAANLSLAYKTLYEDRWVCC